MMAFITLSLHSAPPLSPGHDLALQKIRGEGRPSGEEELLLWLNLDELQCSVCFDDLTTLIDSLNLAPRGLSVPLAAVVRSADTSLDWALRRWARETGIDGPLAVIPAGEFDEVTGGKNSLWLTRGFARILRMWDLPLGAQGQAEVLASLRDR